ncbi:MAG: hypothetical protein AAFP18_14455 [Bacteroidota bacterium]
MRPALLLLLAFAASSLLAQPSDLDDLGRVSLSVVTPESHSDLSEAQLSSLRNTVVRMVTANGISGDGTNADIVIFPVVDLYDKRTVEGMRTLTVIQGELSLFVKNVAQGVTFASFSTPLQGQGTSERQAVTSALRSVDADSRAAADFFDTARLRIADYYAEECDRLLTEAQTLTAAQVYDEAFGIVMSIPDVASDCHARAQRAATEVFNAYRQQRCGAQVQAAQAALANNELGRGLRLLGNVDPSSECRDEASRLARSVAAEADARDRRYYEALQEAYRTSADLESQRIDAARDVAVARAKAAGRVARVYYSYRRPTVTYTTLVRTTTVR